MDKHANWQKYYKKVHDIKFGTILFVKRNLPFDVIVNNSDIDETSTL